MKKLFLMSLLALFLLAAASFAQTHETTSETQSPTNQKCISCHKQTTPGIYHQWMNSAHQGVKVGCYECHLETRKVPDAFEHHGTTISTIVSPKKCGNCHGKEADQYTNSAHANMLDCRMDDSNQVVYNYTLGNRADQPGASPAAVDGCWKCHGSKVTVDKTGKPEYPTWPNFGAGRINPDGSKGSCSACHSFHEFSLARARQPETCKTCHNTSASFEIYAAYESSKHGVNYHMNKDKMNLDAGEWKAGVTYSAAPTCATCHMSATRKSQVTHNVNDRVDIIPKDDAPPNPKCPQDPVFISKEKKEMAKKNMQEVCFSCHTRGYVENAYSQFEGEKKLVKEKWYDNAAPLYRKATEVLQAIEGDQYRPMANEIDWTWTWFKKTIFQAALGAVHLYPGNVETNNLMAATTWYGRFISQIRKIIERGLRHPGVKKQVQELTYLFEETVNKPTFGSGWPKQDEGNTGSK